MCKSIERINFLCIQSCFYFKIIYCFSQIFIFKRKFYNFKVTCLFTLRPFFNIFSLLQIFVPRILCIMRLYQVEINYIGFIKTYFLMTYSRFDGAKYHNYLSLLIPHKFVRIFSLNYNFNALLLFATIWSLRRDHTLSSDLPLMRFFFISPQQKISSLHTGNETDSEFEVFSKRMTFWNIKSNFIYFSLHTRSSSCQLGKCTRKLLLIPLIAMKSGNALDLPLSGISLNTSIVLECMI